MDDSSPIATVLVVEDEAMIRDLAVNALRSAGYAVLEAGCIAEAQQIFRGDMDSIDLLLTDLNLDGESGQDLALAMLADKPDLRVIYTSGGGGSQLDQDRPRSVFLPKPYRLDELTELIDEMLSADR